MERWENIVLEFAEGNLEGFCTSAPAVVESSSAGSDDEVRKIKFALDDFTRFHLNQAFSEDVDALDRAESTRLIQDLMQRIPRLIVSCAESIVDMLLIPVDALMATEFADIVRTHELLRQFYVDTDILNLWPRMDPRVWPEVARVYRIEDEIAEQIREETEAIQTDAETSAPLPIRAKLSAFLRQTKGSRVSARSSHAFSDLCSVFPDLLDLVDLEAFLEVFPDELYLRSTSVCYKPSFARKLALAAVKKWVNAYQYYKKNKELVSRKTIPPKEDVVRACIRAHLDITSGKDRDCEYFWSHLRKTWLSGLTKHGGYHLYEILDHIEHDPGLLTQLLLQLEDENKVEEVASLLIMSESTRCDQRRKFKMDDPVTLMLMSCMQTGRKDQWTSCFGPNKEDGFILPFVVDAGFRGSCPQIDPVSYDVLVIDQVGQLDAVSNFLACTESTVVAVDVFYKTFWSSRLERPVPSVVSVATDKKVFIIMANRMVRNSKFTHAAIRDLFKSLFSNDQILKILGGTRGSEKAFLLWTLIAEDPFDPTMVIADGRLEPYLDLTDVFPRISFSELVFRLLGGLEFCDSEENSNWARADTDFLRETQLHYIASKAWLSLQLFHTITPEDAEEIAPKLSALDFTQVFGNPFMREFAASRDMVESWLELNGAKLAEARDLVEATQEELRMQLLLDLETVDDDHHIEYVESPDFDISL